MVKKQGVIRKAPSGSDDEQRYDSVSAAARANCDGGSYNTSRKYIRLACEGNKAYKGFEWRYVATATDVSEASAEDSAGTTQPQAESPSNEQTAKDAAEEEAKQQRLADKKALENARQELERVQGKLQTAEQKAEQRVRHLETELELVRGRLQTAQDAAKEAEQHKQNMVDAIRGRDQKLQDTTRQLQAAQARVHDLTREPRYCSDLYRARDRAMVTKNNGNGNQNRRADKPKPDQRSRNRSLAQASRGRTTRSVAKNLNGGQSTSGNQQQALARSQKPQDVDRQRHQHAVDSKVEGVLVDKDKGTFYFRCDQGLGSLRNHCCRQSRNRNSYELSKVVENGDGGLEFFLPEPLFFGQTKVGLRDYTKVEINTGEYNLSATLCDICRGQAKRADRAAATTAEIRKKTEDAVDEDRPQEPADGDGSRSRALREAIVKVRGGGDAQSYCGYVYKDAPGLCTGAKPEFQVDYNFAFEFRGEFKAALEEFLCTVDAVQDDPPCIPCATRWFIHNLDLGSVDVPDNIMSQLKKTRIRARAPQDATTCTVEEWMAACRR